MVCFQCTAVQARDGDNAFGIVLPNFLVFNRGKSSYNCTHHEHLNRALQVCIFVTMFLSGGGPDNCCWSPGRMLLKSPSPPPPAALQVLSGDHLVVTLLSARCFCRKLCRKKNPESSEQRGERSGGLSSCEHNCHTQLFRNSYRFSEW